MKESVAQKIAYKERGESHRHYMGAFLSNYIIGKVYTIQ